jgi:hypothetical protein
MSRNSGSGDVAMRNILLTVTLVAVGVSCVAPMTAQADRLQWNGDSLQWSTALAKGQSFRLQGIDGSIRVSTSKDGRVYVEARRSSGREVPLDLLEDRRGVSICVDTCESDRRGWSRGHRVDVVARVPEGVRFNGGMIDGTIDVDELASDVHLATIDGDVHISKSKGYRTHATTIDGDIVFDLVDDEDADFYANTISGSIETDVQLVLDGRSSPPGGRLPRRGSRLWPTELLAGPGQPPQAVRATLGNGGPELRATTISGDIRLRRR